MRLSQLLLCVIVGLVAHQADRPLNRLEKHNPGGAMWYTFVRYGIGVLAVLLCQVMLGHKRQSDAFEDGLLAASCVGIGVFTGHLTDALWEGD